MKKKKPKDKKKAKPIDKKKKSMKLSPAMILDGYVSGDSNGATIT